MRDSLNFTFSEGYFDTGNYVEVPEGSMIYPSSNMVFDANGRLHSFYGLSTAYSGGGTRAFVIDQNIVAFLGNNATTELAVGNIIQGVEKSLWFVGNNLNNSVKVVNISGPTSLEIGSGDTAANLSSTPQTAKWNSTSSRWDTPVQVGLPEFGDSDKPTLDLTTTSTKSTGFDGLVKGSRSVRVARKRYETVSIATPSSEVVTASETGDSVTVTIPPTPADGSADADNMWLLYFTYRGQGSTATHKQFPLEIPEASLVPGGSTTIVTSGNAKYKVISQHATTQSSRVVEIEFNDNELLPIEPNDDTFSLEACKFVAKLGNVMCGIGVGEDSTGFDVSYPNEYEAYPPDWRDWFAEVPIGIAPQEDMGFFWVASANNTYIAKWTGVTEGAAPVIIEKINNLYGTIGEAALTSVNGTLYMLSKGKIPVAISADGQVNNQFGSGVLNALSAYTSATQVVYDQATDTVIFACGTSAIGYHQGIGKWTSPVTLGGTVLSAFPYNGNAHMCFYSGSMSTKKWNGGTDPSSGTWNVTSAFQYGQYGRSLKDIVQTEAILSSTASTGTITFSAYKNFDVTSATTLASQDISASGSLVTIREYVEDIDYDTVAASISGTKGGQTVHSVTYLVDTHKIERLSS